MRPIAVAIVAATLSVPFATESAAPPQKPQQIRGEGCVEPGAETRCLVVRDTKSSNRYILLIKGMQPEIGSGIAFAGIPHTGMTTCMQGTPIDVASWARNDALKCTPGSSPRKWRSQP
jgi:hypothetical protein